MTTLYRVVGHSCDSARPNMNVFRPTVDGSIRGCEHIRIDTPLPAAEADRVANLMRRANLDPSLFPEETL